MFFSSSPIQLPNFYIFMQPSLGYWLSHCSCEACLKYKTLIFTILEKKGELNLLFWEFGHFHQNEIVGQAPAIESALTNIKLSQFRMQTWPIIHNGLKITTNPMSVAAHFYLTVVWHILNLSFPNAHTRTHTFRMAICCSIIHFYVSYTHTLKYIQIHLHYRHWSIRSASIVKHAKSWIGKFIAKV